MAYDLSRLGDKRFEHLTQSLAIAELGPGVQVFGDGPDGGREASFEGDFDLQTGARWSGYGVLQAKYKEHLNGMPLDQTWFFSQLRTELSHWVKEGSKRRRKPQYLRIATNVRLSAVADTGGIDGLDDLFDEYADKGLRLNGYQVWHAEKIERLLDNHYDIRRAYADLVLPGDVIARLHEQLQESDAKIEQAWLGHAGQALLANQTVALGEAGDAANTPLALEQVAVDLVAAFDGEENTIRGALASIIERGDNVLAPNLYPTGKSRIVILGGPGQGKSTISRLLCQLYRVAMLASQEPSSIVGEVRQAAARMRTAFDAAALPKPTLSRVPIYAALSGYADDISGGADVSLRRYLTQIVNRRASEHLSDAEMRRLLRVWPSAIVLDGLDEVASPSVRVDVIDRITEFMGEMAAINADVLLVCTSRSQGFENALPLEHYDHLILERMQGHDALTYATRLLDIRHANDADRRDLVAERLKNAAEEPATAKLMETPLQVTIMALLLESLSRPPSNRHGLFDNYYEVVYAREVNKPGHVGALLDRHRGQIDAIHARTALLLHRKAETAGEAESIMSTSDFRDTARDLLTAEQWPEAEAGPLAEQLVTAASQRLVLIVPKGDGVGFEVRSLQEFMAAKALTDGSDVDIPARLEAIAAAAHWRNTWLLAAGRVFADRRSLRGDITSLIDRIDDADLASMLAMPGARLAVDVIDDGLASTSPMYEVNLVNSATRLLDGPPCLDIFLLADVIRTPMETSTQVRGAVENQVVKRTSTTSPVPLGTLAFLAALAAKKAGPIAEWARLRRDRVIRRLVEAQPADEPEILYLGQDWPAPPSKSRELVSRIAKLNEDDLIAAAAREDLSVSRGEANVPIITAMERSLDTFDRRITNNPQLLRDVAAMYARDLKVADWPVAAAIRNALAKAIERDETQDRLDAVIGQPA